MFWKKVSLDESVFGWNCHWMKVSLDDFVCKLDESVPNRFYPIWQFALFLVPSPVTFKNVKNNEMQKEGQEKSVGAKTETLCADFGVGPRLSVQCRRPQAGDVEQKNAVQPQSRVPGFRLQVSWFRVV